MGKKKGIEISIAIAEAVKQANADVVAAYPITPQTHIVEHLSEFVNNGELQAEFIPVESEHSAMSVCCGTSAAGARTFTATASQGLALMVEIMYIAAGMRLPIVMTVVSRTLSSPLGIWNDHSDIMLARDAGWIVIFAENGQEAYDNTFCAFKIAEHPDVLNPTIVDIDGFILSHVVEAIEFVDDEIIQKFLPDYVPKYALRADKPLTMGAFAMPETYSEIKKSHDINLRNSIHTIKKVWKEWGDLTGRYYNPVEEYKTDDAETVFLTMGSFGETASVAVDELREKGEKVGLVKLRLWRPFPEKELQDTLRKFKNVLVIDRWVIGGGYGGPVASEIKTALYHFDDKPFIVDFVAGLGGRDVNVYDFIKMYETGVNDYKNNKTQNFYYYGVRG